MNQEDQIAALLAQKVADPVPEPTTVVPETPEEPQNFIDKMTPEEVFTKQQLLDFFAIPPGERHDPRVDNYVETVYNWARENAGTGEYHQLLRVITEQEMHMGSRTKPGRLQKLADYVKIAKLRQQLAIRERELYL